MYRALMFNNQWQRRIDYSKGIVKFNQAGAALFVVNGLFIVAMSVRPQPQDVEGISVLKDAASTSAYGAQGSFGVIIVTLKKERS
jgi:TonB-dependent SusC/RagA subfamily outer membrane receptor